MKAIVEKQLIWKLNGNEVITAYWSLNYGYISFYYFDLTFAGDILVTDYLSMLAQGKVKTDYSFVLSI